MLGSLLLGAQPLYAAGLLIGSLQGPRSKKGKVLQCFLDALWVVRLGDTNVAQMLLVDSWEGLKFSSMTTIRPLYLSAKGSEPGICKQTQVMGHDDYLIDNGPNK